MLPGQTRRLQPISMYGPLSMMPRGGGTLQLPELETGNDFRRSNSYLPHPVGPCAVTYNYSSALTTYRSLAQSSKPTPLSSSSARSDNRSTVCSEQWRALRSERVWKRRSVWRSQRRRRSQTTALTIHVCSHPPTYACSCYFVITLLWSCLIRGKRH